MPRRLASVLIGAVLALLLALVSLFVFVPIVGHVGQGLARAAAAAVFCGVMLFVISAVRRGQAS